MNSSKINHLIENAPNASKLISSLRHLDYSSTSAICDIVDNSIDAGADVIRIKISAENKKVSSVEIWDNGCGMNRETLHESLRLGSNTEKNERYDLGKYGMGLVTASISIGEYVKVTSCHNSAVHVGIQDLEQIREENKFIIDLYEDINVDSFLHSLKELTSSSALSGTCVSIGSIDRWQWVQLAASERNIAETLGQVFRKFINAGKRIFVNDTEVQSIDPIYDYKPELLAEESFILNNEKIEVRIFEVQNTGESSNKEFGINIKNQGFYILRNSREIATGETFGIFTKHNSLNTFRAEFSFPATLDDEMVSGFTKQNINPQMNQSFYDKLKNFVNPYLKQVRKKSEKRSQDYRTVQEDYENVERYITQKAHLLKTPVSEKERRDRVDNKKDALKDKTLSSKASSPRLDITKKKKTNLDALNVSFRTKSFSAAGPLYESEIEKNKTVINWNIDHAFYKEFIIPHSGNPDVLNPICFLIYSLASAELRSSVDSDSETILENIRADLSQNLRVLMNT